MRLLSIWDVGKCHKADTSGSLLFRHRKNSHNMYSNIHYIAESWWLNINPPTLENVYGLVKAALPTKTDVLLYCEYSCMLHLQISVGSSAADSVFIVFQFRLLQNDVNIYSFPNPFCLCFIYSYFSCNHSLFESFGFHLLQNWFRIENIGTDVFRCGVNPAQ